MRMIIDVSSIAKTGLYEGRDEEFGKDVEFDGKIVHVNGWQHGFERFTGYVTATMSRFKIQPHDVIMVTDGMNSKARRVAIYEGYKGNRPDRPEEYNVQFNLLKDEIISSFRAIGAHAVTQDGVEADDIIGYLAQQLRGDTLVLSNDGDMAVLVNDRVKLVKGGMLVEDNPIGPFDTKFVTVYKALVGDSSDNIKGAFKFGPKSFLDFLVWADGDAGLAAIEGMIKRRTLHELTEDVPEFKPLQKIVDSHADVYKCYDVAKLHPEWCNTLRQPLQWQAGMVRGKDVVLDARLRVYAQQVRLITEGNYAAAMEFLALNVGLSPIVALDIETSTPEASDEWLQVRNAPEKVDVFGSSLTGCGLTFGANGQYTYYFSVNHKDTANVSAAQVAAAVALVPRDTHIVVHNASFELPILYAEWCEMPGWKDNGWHGFLPNVLDTKNLASYVDENQSLGLKKLSAHYLGYEQTTYAEVTGGRKMHQLTGEEVLAYGADDTICTAALYHFFKLVMEIEDTWDVMLEVEQLPAYVTALAFHHGTNFDNGAMKKMAAEDQAAWEEHAVVLREFLIAKGWAGTVCPVYDENITPAQVKEMVEIVLGIELDTRVRTISKMAKLIEILDHPDAPSLALNLEQGNFDVLNGLVAHHFTGVAELDTDSPKQMKEFLYETLGLPVRIVGSCTPLERKNKPDLAQVVSRYKKIWAGSQTEQPLGEWEQELLKSKAKTNEIAIAFAVLMDSGNPDIFILKHIQAMKKVETRFKLYYTPYANICHWKDQKIHAQVNQNGTITRRYSSSDPNLQQLPKKGEGVKFRKCFLPHRKNAVVCSVDFAGQELRQGAGMSMDPGMLSCYVGDNLRDIHSMTAAGAMIKKWGRTKLSELIETFGQDGDDEYALFVRLHKHVKSEAPEVAKMADDLRKNAKNVNFGAQYDAQAPKLAETLLIPVADAEAFLQAKFAMFPGFEKWKDEVKKEASNLGYVKTCMGARRHLRESLMSREFGVADKALRQGPNFKIQGSSAEQTKLAMARLWRSGILFSLDMRFFAPIHDELVWSAHRDDAVESCRVVNECMVVPYGDLPVPFLGSISLGPNLGDQTECGDEFDAAAISKALAELFKEKNKNEEVFA